MNVAVLSKATDLAWRWHGHQTRKGKSSPYMSHLLQVQGLVIDFGGDSDQAVAALLHDSLEDADTPTERGEREIEIQKRFGRRVFDIVLDCTDTVPGEAGSDKGPWRVRKERYLSQLRSAHVDSLLVAACDKRHNLGDLLGDLRLEGLSTFDRFSVGPEQQLWYFDSVEAIFRDQVPGRLASDLSRLVSDLHSLVDGASPAPPDK